MVRRDPAGRRRRFEKPVDAAAPLAASTPLELLLVPTFALLPLRLLPRSVAEDKQLLLAGH